MRTAIRVWGSILVWVATAGSGFAQTGPYAPWPGQAGSTAVLADAPEIVAWASAVVDYQPGAELDAEWQDTTEAIGPAGNDTHGILGLGRGGSVTLGFAKPITDGPGADFAVFENGFSHFFLELAFVEVSSDGVHFTRFPNDSLTAEPVAAFGISDPRNIDGLAGKYALGYGTPFDLAALVGTPGLDVGAIRFVRLIDIVGDGGATDSSGNPVYDPYPTVGSAGFDLDGVGVFHEAATGDSVLNVSSVAFSEGDLTITWPGRADRAYRVFTTNRLDAWSLAGELPGVDGPMSITLDSEGADQFLARVEATPAEPEAEPSG